MDEGTNALDIIDGRVYPLRLGYIGVKCRSQKDILVEKPMKEALREEYEFFRNSQVYGHYSSKLGIPYLTKSLNKLIAQ